MDLAMVVGQWRADVEDKWMKRLGDNNEVWAPFGNPDLKSNYKVKDQSTKPLDDKSADENLWGPFGNLGNREILKSSYKKKRGWGLSSNNFEIEPDVKHIETIDAKGDNAKKGFLSGFGMPGAGAPRRDEAGNVKTNLVSHDDLILQAKLVGKKDFLSASVPAGHDFERVERYKKDLDEQEKERKARLKQEKERDLELELQRGGMFEFGALEKPVDPQRGHRKWKTDSSKIPEPKVGLYDPWGKDFPERDPEGNVKRHQHSKMRNGIMQLAGSTEDESLLGAELMRSQVKRAPQFKKVCNIQGERFYDIAEFAENFHNFTPYDPFGKPGCGAPRRDENGEIITRVPYTEVTDPFIERQKQWSKKFYLDEIREAMKAQKDAKLQMRSFDTAQCDDLADILDRSAVGKVKRNSETGFIEPRRHVASDVTNPELVGSHLPSSASQKFSEVPFANQQQESLGVKIRYFDDLRRQMAERERMSKLNQIREKHEAKQHYDTQNHFWGRLGVGGNRSKQQLISTDFKHHVVSLNEVEQGDKPNLQRPFVPSEEKSEPQKKDHRRRVFFLDQDNQSSDDQAKTKTRDFRRKGGLTEICNAKGEFSLASV